MFLGKAIFPGTSTLNQIEKIIELLGRPSSEDMISIESDLGNNIIDSLKVTKRKTFSKTFPNANPLALDLIRKLLKFNPL